MWVVGNGLDEAVFMAVPKPMLTEFGRVGWESCDMVKEYRF